LSVADDHDVRPADFVKAAILYGFSNAAALVIEPVSHTASRSLDESAVIAFASRFASSESFFALSSFFCELLFEPLLSGVSSPLLLIASTTPTTIAAITITATTAAVMIAVAAVEARSAA
jgi:hypothetical protein